MSIGGALVASWEVVETWFATACDVVRGVRREAEPLIDRLRRREPRSEPPGAPTAERDLVQEVREAKYVMPRRGPAAVPPGSSTGDGLVERETGPLPTAYGTDRIVALARDPWWLFAYWEVTPAGRAAALRTLGADAASARQVLRVHELSDGGQRSVDVEPARDAESAYLQVPRPAAEYAVEIGLRAATGRFVPVARSLTVATPAAQPSADTGVRWIELAADGERTNGTGQHDRPGGEHDPPRSPVR